MSYLAGSGAQAVAPIPGWRFADRRCV